MRFRLFLSLLLLTGCVRYSVPAASPGEAYVFMGGELALPPPADQSDRRTQWRIAATPPVLVRQSRTQIVADSIADAAAKRGILISDTARFELVATIKRFSLQATGCEGEIQLAIDFVLRERQTGETRLEISQRRKATTQSCAIHEMIGELSGNLQELVATFFDGPFANTWIALRNAAPAADTQKQQD